MASSEKGVTKKRLLGLLSLTVTIIAGIYFPLANFQSWPPFTRSPKLQLEHAIVKDRPGKFPVLDVKVLNTGNQTAVLREARFTVDKIWKLTPSNLLMYNALEPSAKYEIMLKIRDQQAYSASIGISHALQPDETDRFTVRLKHNAPVQEDYIVRMTVELIYGNTKLMIPTLLYVAQRPGSEGRYLVSEETRSIAWELQNVVGTKSEGFENLISNILSQG